MILVDPDPANCRDPTGLDTQPCFERKARMFAKWISYILYNYKLYTDILYTDILYTVYSLYSHFLY